MKKLKNLKNKNWTKLNKCHYFHFKPLVKDVNLRKSSLMKDKKSREMKSVKKKRDHITDKN